MNIQNLVNWSKKAFSLKRKYEKEKNSVVNKLAKDVGIKKGLFSRSKAPELDNVIRYRDSLINIVTKKQVPLYNNIVNYSGIALGMIPRDRAISNVKSQLNLFIEEGQKVREILEAQHSILQSMGGSTYNREAIVTLIDLWKKEKKLVDAMEKASKNMQKTVLTLVNDIMNKFRDTVGKKSVRPVIFIREHKNLVKCLRMASMIAMAVGIMSGTDISDLARNINRLTQVLESV